MGRRPSGTSARTRAVALAATALLVAAGCDEGLVCGALACEDTLRIVLQPAYDGPIRWTLLNAQGEPWAECDPQADAGFASSCIDQGSTGARFALAHAASDDFTGFRVVAEAVDGSWRVVRPLQPDVAERRRPNGPDCPPVCSALRQVVERDLALGTVQNGGP